MAIYWDALFKFAALAALGNILLFLADLEGYKN